MKNYILAFFWKFLNQIVRKEYERYYPPRRKGTRLSPLSHVVSKQLLPIYDKPMIYYPLSILMLAGIRDILIITTPDDMALYKKLLGDGAQWGINFTYLVQPSPNGVAEVFILGKDFIANDCVSLILGDNLFYGSGLLDDVLTDVTELENGAIIFAYKVQNPQNYGVVEIDDNDNALSLDEKPNNPKSNYAVPGIYFYDSSVCEKAEKIIPSSRGELEITDFNQQYLEEGKLKVYRFGRGFTWLDAGTHDSLLQAANFVQTIEQRQGLMIACPEEISLRKGWITKEQVRKVGEAIRNEYGNYLLRLLKEDVFS